MPSLRMTNETQRLLALTVDDLRNVVRDAVLVMDWADTATAEQFAQTIATHQCNKMCKALGWDNGAFDPALFRIQAMIDPKPDVYEEPECVTLAKREQRAPRAPRPRY